MLKKDFELLKDELTADLLRATSPDAIARVGVAVNLALAGVVNDLVCVLRKTSALLAEPKTDDVIRREKEARDTSDVVQIESEAESLLGGETLDEKQFAALKR